MQVQGEICDSRHSFIVFSVLYIIVQITNGKCYLVIFGAAAAEVCCQCGESEEETGSGHSPHEAQGLLVEVRVGSEAGVLQPVQGDVHMGDLVQEPHQPTGTVH